MQDCIGVTYTATQSTPGTIQARSQLFFNFISPKGKNCKKSLLYSNSINTGTIQARSQLFINFVSAKLQDCIGVTYTATQSTLELFKLEVNYSSTSFHKSERLQLLYSNSINTGTIQARSQLFINFVSAKLQDCIGVTYTATQSILELFKLEVNYSSTLFQQNCKIA